MQNTGSYLCIYYGTNSEYKHHCIALNNLDVMAGSTGHDDSREQPPLLAKSKARNLLLCCNIFCFSCLSSCKKSCKNSGKFSIWSSSVLRNVTGVCVVLYKSFKKWRHLSHCYKQLTAFTKQNATNLTRVSFQLKRNSLVGKKTQLIYLVVTIFNGSSSVLHETAGLTRRIFCLPKITKTSCCSCVLARTTGRVKPKGRGRRKCALFVEFLFAL